MVFKASEFQGVSEWPILFSLFQSEQILSNGIFKFCVKEKDSKDIIHIKDEVTLYNIDNQSSLRNWVLQKTNKLFKNRKVFKL